MGKLIKYRGFIIAPNDYPHPIYKYVYYLENDTDGQFSMCETIDECKKEIDDNL